MAQRAADDRIGKPVGQERIKAALGRISTTRAKTIVRVRNNDRWRQSAAIKGEADCANVGSAAPALDVRMLHGLLVRRNVWSRRWDIQGWNAGSEDGHTSPSPGK